MSDFNWLGSMSGMLSVMTTGKLNAHQTELAKRIAVKVIAVLGMTDSEKGRNTPLLIRKECRHQSQSAADYFAAADVEYFVAVAVVVAPSLLAFAVDIVAGFPHAG